MSAQMPSLVHPMPFSSSPSGNGSPTQQGAATGASMGASAMAGPMAVSPMGMPGGSAGAPNVNAGPHVAAALNQYASLAAAAQTLRLAQIAAAGGNGTVLLVSNLSDEVCTRFLHPLHSLSFPISLYFYFSCSLFFLKILISCCKHYFLKYTLPINHTSYNSLKHISSSPTLSK